MVATIYRPMRSEPDFLREVELGATTESVYLEFKGAVERDLRKVAVDIAAFANTWGGTLLYGVNERDVDGVGVADEVAGVVFDDARESIERAVQNWLVPNPAHVRCDLIRVGSPPEQKVLLACNVNPDERPIAVRNENKSWHYPYRTNEGNFYMGADQVVERANASHRAGQIALMQSAELIGQVVPNGPGRFGVSGCRIEIVSGTYIINAHSPTGFEYRKAHAFLEAMDPYQFQLRIDFSHDPRKRTWLPYGMIKQAWPSDGCVGLVLDAKLVGTDKDWFLRGA